jgi:penicillin-binding protein 1A
MKEKILNLFYLLVGILLIGVLSVVGVITYFSFDLPKISSLADYRPHLPSRILAKDGTVLAELGEQKRELVEIKDVPKMVIEAFLSAEDDAFYEHKGVDYQGVLRALIVNLKAGKIVQGGSTITQQVAKSLLLNQERSVSRKIKDFLLAQRIEKEFSKEEILYLYLNQVYLGGGYYGIKAAFRGYFGKELFEATLAEAAMVAGLLVAPGKYSPYINPKFAKKRQAYVLKRLLSNNRVSRQEYEQALEEKIKYRIKKPNPLKAGHFTDWVRQEVIKHVGEKELLRGGLKIHTTLDWTLQQKAEREVIKGIKRIDKRQGLKGNFLHLKDDLAIENQEIDLRKKISLLKSEYFTFDHDLNRAYEISFNKDDYSFLKEKVKAKLKELTPSIFYPGIVKEDPFWKRIEVGKTYKAVVVKVTNLGRVIYASLGGQSVIIPQKYFAWAHERHIGEEKRIFPQVSRPSRIVKKGDVIQVKILKKEAGLINYLHRPFFSRYKESKNKRKLEHIKLARMERYILGELDQEPEVEGALISLLPKTGNIVAMVGGYSFQHSQFNRALQAKRQPGSCFKPLLYAMGLEEGMTPSSIIIDSPETLLGVDKSIKWKPRNYDGKFKGAITFRSALEQSRNVPTIKLANNLGVNKILEFIKRIDLDVEVEKDLSIALGSFGVSLIEIVRAYGIFPNEGKLVYPKAITSIMDREGNPISINFDVPSREETYEDEEISSNPYLNKLRGSYVYDQRLSYIMSNLLKGVILHGTGRGAKSISSFIGGKTGTTNKYVDAWFVGFSANLLTGVWTGHDNNQMMGWGETGAKAALPIWKGFMREGLKSFGERDFRVPDGIINVLIDKESGQIPRESSKLVFMEAFVEGTQPGIEKKQLEQEEVDPVDKAEISFEDDEYYNFQN